MIIIITLPPSNAVWLESRTRLVPWLLQWPYTRRCKNCTKLSHVLHSQCSTPITITFSTPTATSAPQWEHGMLQTVQLDVPSQLQHCSVAALMGLAFLSRNVSEETLTRDKFWWCFDKMCGLWMLRILVKLLETSRDPLILSVAAHDIGDYVRHYPRGKTYVRLFSVCCFLTRLLTGRIRKMSYSFSFLLSFDGWGITHYVLHKCMPHLHTYLVQYNVLKFTVEGWGLNWCSSWKISKLNKNGKQPCE